jgi:hypothetical protein
MRSVASHLVFLFLFILSSQVLTAQVHVAITIANGKMTATYLPQANYNTFPLNTWSYQEFTVSVPEYAKVQWSNLQNNSVFKYAEQGPAFSGGDGYEYKTFISLATNVTVDMSNGVPLDLFTIDVSALYTTYFDVSANIITKGYTGPPIITNNGTKSDVFGNIAYIGNQQLKVLTSTMSVASEVITDPFEMDITFSMPVFGLDISDFDVDNCKLNYITQKSDTSFTLNYSPISEGTLKSILRIGEVSNSLGETNKEPSTVAYSFYKPYNCMVQYHLQEQNDGYYQISLIPNINWSGTDAITATAQVTIKVSSVSTSFDEFTVTDLTMLVPGVTWSQNSRYKTPTENYGIDYISFGMTTYGTNLIPYVAGDTVPLFRFKNTGICSGDSVFLMPISGDPFAWPNSLNANVGQQLSVSGYNEPDVPLCVAGVASCMAEVNFDFKALLQGAYVSADALMHDQLRAQSLLPEQEPYTNYEPVRGSGFLPFLHHDEGGLESVKDISIFSDGYNAEDLIVDWVFIELRSKYDPEIIVTTKSGLIQRDGDIKDTDGKSSLRFSKLRDDSYYLTVRHRNHLGLMTTFPITLQNLLTTLDFTDTLVAMYGEPAFDSQTNDRPGDPVPTFSKYPGVRVDGKRLLWAGNSNADRYVMFQGGGVGEGLDIDNVFDNIFSDPLNANYSYNHVRNGYYPGDNNMDGKVKYQGPANDVDPFIFFNIISRHPDNIDKYINFYITEGLLRE